MKRNVKISELLKPLSEKPLQAFLSDALQVADVLDWILGQVGVAEIWQTSFSVSEEFLRRLSFITRSRKVSGVNLVLDLKATNKTIKLWPFIESVADKAFLANNHSKLLLVRGGDYKVSVITSQNLARGNRFESTVITTSEEVYDELFECVRCLVKKSIPLHDVFRDKITAG